MFKSIAPTAITTTNNTSAGTVNTTKHSSSTQPLQKNVPAFLNKLYSMVNDPESDDLICWADDGASFFVNRQEDFARKVLPRFFKHNKFSSFVRQLNMYGFHKVPHLQQGVLETDSDSERWEFSNPNFQRNQPDLLLLVTRKKGPSADEKEFSTIDLHHILEEIRSIKKHQLNISSQLQAIQRENRSLWQDTIQARERHSRHQETIDKILRFLASVFSNGEKRAAIPRKRRFLLGPASGDDLENDLVEELLDIKQEPETERPTKIARQDPPSNGFNLDDYVNGKNDVVRLSSTLPPHIKRSASAPNTSSTLKDAIALNDQAKQDNQALTTSMHDFSNNNIPQIQNLQNLIALAQANPDLLSQLTNEAFYNNSNNSNNNNINGITDQSSLASLAIPNHNSNNNNNNALAASPDQKLHQVTNSINNIADSTEALNQDIDDLGLSLQVLAQHLGFDPTKLTSNANSLMFSDQQPQPQQEQPNEDDLIDMDEFLNAYGK
ncbi:uncharacterized protein B0P05DRAFT_572099 [Gilbertella persicaria]|uniref:uncharacterized protein n=1 Tax=Gilbertella persicaria TaxID=101096 RepID=UPI002220E285|nr:uncharacterized protein B0P05DRAFT_572099 [Gilbertella persicaria]KAI8077228.1 hypothetical protein B0P05DRAFT_572099 [Gilbertella persicaria]